MMAAAVTIEDKIIITLNWKGKFLDDVIRDTLMRFRRDNDAGGQNHRFLFSSSIMPLM
jgi:hypothetical protein